MKFHETHLALSNAIHSWWLARRPHHWSEKQHLENPIVNCDSRIEDDLANAYAEVVRTKNALAAGIYEAFASGHRVTVHLPSEGYAFFIETDEAVKGINVPASVRVSVDEDGIRHFSVSYGAPLGYVMNRVELDSNGRSVTSSGLVFYQDPPDAE